MPRLAVSLAVQASLVGMMFTSGCGYKTVGQESYRIRGSSGASLGAYGIKDKAGFHSFEHIETPETVIELIEDGWVQTLVEFDEISTKKGEVKVGGKVTGKGADGTIVWVKLAKTHTVVERIPKARLIEIYNGSNELLSRLRSDPSYRIITAIVRDVDSVVITGLSADLAARLGSADLDVEGLLPSLLAGLPAGHGRFKFDSTKQRVYLGGRITGYQMSHCCWDGDTLVGLKTDRPWVNDKLPNGWSPAAKVEQSVLAKD